MSLTIANKNVGLFFFLFSLLIGTALMGVASAEEDVTPSDSCGLNPESAEAARFLIQASFGPTCRDINKIVDGGNADIVDGLVNGNDKGIEGWIDEQMALPESYHLEAMLATGNHINRSTRYKAWFKIAVQGEDQLRQRVAYALSQIFVISDQNTTVAKNSDGVAWYYDILVEHAFGDFQALLKAITLSPQMGEYLSMRNNYKAAPGRRVDENYAREIMQLFTVGLDTLNQDGTPRLQDGQAIPSYTQKDVENLARVFTGWKLGDRGTERHKWLVPMKADEGEHDTDQKVIIGGVVVPAGGSAEVDLDLALDALVAHPNVGPFIARRLIQRLVSSNPSPQYIERVASAFNDNGEGKRGQLDAVVRAILLDPEARTPQSGVMGAKPKEPLLHLMQLWRAFDGRGANGFNYQRPYTHFGQAPLSAPSVFNFYTPDFAPQGDIKRAYLVAPEFELSNESAQAIRLNALYERVYHGNRIVPEPAPNSGISIDVSEAAILAYNDVDALVDHLNLMLMGGQMPADLRDFLTEYLPTVPLNRNLQARTEQQKGRKRALDGIYLTVSSPYFAVQH